MQPQSDIESTVCAAFIFIPSESILGPFCSHLSVGRPGLLFWPFSPLRTDPQKERSQEKPFLLPRLGFGLPTHRLKGPWLLSYSFNLARVTTHPIDRKLEPSGLVPRLLILLPHHLLPSIPLSKRALCGVYQLLYILKAKRKMRGKASPFDTVVRPVLVW